MRLLNATTYEFREFRLRGTRPQYAILSHRWLPEEVTFVDLRPKELQDGSIVTPQLDKIRNTCRQAREDKLDWVWIDSCCINKDSSEETTRSINAMFNWYQEAAVCYTYLADVEASDEKASVFKTVDSKDSEWFERGWTLQELLAPRKMKLFDTDWAPMGTRAQLAHEIARITGIETRFLDGSEGFRSASIATRLSWQSRRKTTEEEDIVYSLLGIMGVSLMPIYGEGRQSFMKLQQELLKSYPDESIFAWRAPSSGLPNHDSTWGPGEWGLLAPWVDCFQHARDIVVLSSTPNRPAGGITPVAGGIKFPMPLKELGQVLPWEAALLIASAITVIGPLFVTPISRRRHRHRRQWALTLNCGTKNHLGRLGAIQVFLCRHSHGDDFWRRCSCENLGLTERKPSPGSSNAKSTTTEIIIVQPSGVWWPAIA